MVLSCTCGPAGTDECSFNSRCLEICISTCMGIPVAEEKLEGPTTALDFLGILIDTVKEDFQCVH